MGGQGQKGNETETERTKKNFPTSHTMILTIRAAK